MKTHKFLSVIIILSFSFVSCSSFEDEHCISEYKENAEMLNSNMIIELQSFNDSVISIHNVTRGWTTRQWINVVSADLGGAWVGGKVGAKIGGYIGTGLGNPITGGVFGGFIGGIIGGGFNSWRNSPDYCIKIESDDAFNEMTYGTKALLKSDLKINSEKIEYLDDLAAKKINIDDKLLANVYLTDKQKDIGKMHNILLSYIDGSIAIKDEQNARSYVEESNDIDQRLIDETVNSKEFKEQYEVALKHLEDDYEYNTKSEYVIKLFNNVFLNYASENEDVVLLINKYTDIIKASNELTDDEKELVYGALSTALFSFNYWNIMEKTK